MIEEHRRLTRSYAPFSNHGLLSSITDEERPFDKKDRAALRRGRRAGEGDTA